MTKMDDVIKHAVMASHDDELSSIIILMVTKGSKEPEVHMALSTEDLHHMNTSVDLLKLEVLRLMTAGTEIKKDRE
jgi:hypothetical protein